MKPEIVPTGVSPPLGEEEEIYLALVTGVRDYVRKNGFEKVVIGLSGGIDSALTAAIAADALGPENVTGVTMPSQFSSAGSISDSEELARNLGIKLLKIPIQEIYKAYLGELAPHFRGLPFDITEENLQARIRANLLMALSNKFGWLVLSTGNKSEISVGYCTIYGDMVGGYAVLKDVPKTYVYRLARWRNRKAGFSLIPEAILTKVPSAELRPNQTDQDTLPPYEVLDAIIEAYVEKDMSFREILALGYDPNVVRDVLRRIDAAEYKRRQAPPGVKITPRAYGKDRRMPITNRYREG
jgi:NAD+ synthase (glutamine-hydrolysing)